jgi:hypothetical protein
MAQQIREIIPHSKDIGAAGIADAAPIIEEHPLFPEWLAAFEHLVKTHERVKAADGGSPNALDLQKELTAAKAAYLSLANQLD